MLIGPYNLRLKLGLFRRTKWYKLYLNMNHYDERIELIDCFFVDQDNRRLKFDPKKAVPLHIFNDICLDAERRYRSGKYFSNECLFDSICLEVKDD